MEGRRRRSSRSRQGEVGEVEELGRRVEELEEENRRLRGRNQELVVENTRLRRGESRGGVAGEGQAPALKQAFESIVGEWRVGFSQQRTFERARELASGFVLGLGRKTITGALCAVGRELEDWSATYRLFCRGRYARRALFAPLLRRTVSYTEGLPFFPVALDDSSVSKTGKRVYGAQTLRQPLSLPCHVNLRKGQRLLQACGLVSGEPGAVPARGVPIAFELAPSARKPKRDAPPEEWAAYRKLAKAVNLGRQAARMVQELRGELDELLGGQSKPMLVCVDGSLANRSFLGHLPGNTNWIARVRKDTAVFAPAGPDAGRRVYGERLPTPEQVRQDASYAWQRIRVYAAGKKHGLDIKVVSPVLWQHTTQRQPVRVIVIRALRYRRSKKAKLLYRRAAYLLTSDLSTPVQKLVQAYIHRWEIEVTWRDEKQVLGLGQAQVVTEESARRVPAFVAATYGAMLLAAEEAFGSQRTPDYLPLPRWRKRPGPRPSFNDLVARYRYDVWSVGLQPYSQSGCSGYEALWSAHPPLHAALYASR